MKPLRVLFFTSELAPLTDDGNLALATSSLCRALAACPIDLTVVAPRGNGRDPERLGYARRLEPLRVPRDGGEDAEVTLFEGTLPSGGGRVFALDAGEGEAFYRAGLELARTRGFWPHVLHAGYGTEEVASELEAFEQGDLPPPALVFSRDLDIPPGLDQARWHPGADPVSRKAEAKLELQRIWGLPPRARTPLIAVVGPFDGEILRPEDASALASLDAQLALLGQAGRDDDALPTLRDLATRNSTCVAVRVADERAVERSLYAAADLALFARQPPEQAPSDLHCLLFGAVPIAPRVGDYAHLLVDFDERTATGSGFLFTAVRAAACVDATKRGLRAYQNSEAFEVLSRRVAAMDLSWETAALRHLDVYRSATLL